MNFWPTEPPSPLLAWMMKNHLYWLYILFDNEERRQNRAYEKFIKCCEDDTPDCDCEEECKRA